MDTRGTRRLLAGIDAWEAMTPAQRQAARTARAEERQRENRQED